MRYLIDGYNLLFRRLKSRHSLEQKRNLLVSDLNELANALKIDVTIVFDGTPDPRRGHFDAIEIVYTGKGESADAYITEEVERVKRPKELTVVSNDKELTMRCHQRGAHTLNIDEFIAFLLKKKTKKPTVARAFQESKSELARLLAVFEKRLLEDSES